MGAGSRIEIGLSYRPASAGILVQSLLLHWLTRNWVSDPDLHGSPIGFSLRICTLICELDPDPDPVAIKFATKTHFKIDSDP
jgi:hypothetical protein